MMTKITKTLSGVVVSNPTTNTAVVEVTVWKVHRLFHKRYKKTKRYLVENTAHTTPVGQITNITPCRPLSKRKHWTIVAEHPTRSESKPKKVEDAKRTAPKRKKGKV